MKRKSNVDRALTRIDRELTRDEIYELWIQLCSKLPMKSGGSRSKAELMAIIDASFPDEKVEG